MQQRLETMVDQDEEKIELALEYLFLMTRDPDLVEISTGWRRTFAYDNGPRVAKSALTADDFERYFDPGLKESIEQSWGGLLTTSVDEIRNAIEAKKRQDQQAKQESYPFNQPDALFIDMDFWARSATWTDEEAVMLSLDRHPLPPYLESIKNVSDNELQECLIAQHFFDRIALVEAAKKAGQISSTGKSIDFVNWFERMEFETSEELINKVRHFQGKPAGSAARKSVNLSDQQENTLLKLVAAMAVRGYSFDPSKHRNQATADIRSDLELLGLELDDKTVLKWLRAATDLIHKDFWKTD